MTGPFFPSVDSATLRLRDQHLPDRLSPANLVETIQDTVGGMTAAVSPATAAYNDTLGTLTVGVDPAVLNETIRTAISSVIGPRIVQSANAYAAAGTLTGTLSAATAGNALLWVAAMDKNPGTLAMSGSGWSTPVNLRATDVSLAVSWKTAAGGETALTGTITGTAPPAGSRVWVAELAAVGSGAWTVLSASANSDGTTVTARATGTTSAVAVPAALALGFWAVDSVGNAGTVYSYTNGFTGYFTPTSTLNGQGDGIGEGGLWVATRVMPSGLSGLAGSTLTRNGTADQMSGAVLAIGRA